MRFMLDTNFCIDLMRGKANGAFARLRSMAVDEVGISTVTLAELQYGASKSKRREYHQAMIVAFFAPLLIATFDARASEVYGSVRARLEKSGTPIGSLDTLIAAHAIAEGAVIVTANTREFRRVDGLAVENWRTR